MVSIGIGMYRKIYPPELLGSILGINALIVALGTVAGPTLGGIIVSTLGWPWLFLINVPFGVAALYLGLRNLPGRGQRRGSTCPASATRAGHRIRGDRHRPGRTLGQWHRLDLAAAAPCWPPCSCAGSAAWTRPCCRWTSSRPSAFLRRRGLAGRVLGTGHFLRGLPFLFQSVYGYSAIQSALLFTPWPVVVTVAAPLSDGCPTRSTRPCCPPSASASSRWGCS